MSIEILNVVDAFSNEKALDKEDVFQSLELALSFATKKQLDRQEQDVVVEIDRKTGEYSTHRQWLVMADDDPAFESPDRHILESYAKQQDLDIPVGEYKREAIESIGYGRIVAQTVKQVIVQNIRKAERAKGAEKYSESVGEMVVGTVKRVEKRGIFVDLGDNCEAYMPREEMIPRENFRNGDRIRGLIKEIEDQSRGPQIIMSRSDDRFLTALLTLEVPEIGQELIDVMAAARVPGIRAKVAVRANVPNLDPIGACIGMSGSRIKTVTSELNEEKVDIIPWDDDVTNFVINAMQPAEVLSIVVDEDNQSMDISVEEDSLSKAIGAGGQNIRLASKLVGWTLNVMSEEQFDSKLEQEQQTLIAYFVDQLDVDEEVAEIIAAEGFTSMEEVAYVADEEFERIEAFDAEIVEELRARARNVLLTKAVAGDAGEPQEDLVSMKGMYPALAQLLATRGITTMEDLAEQAVDDIADIKGVSEEFASSLIMTAREPWFAEAQEAE